MYLTKENQEIYDGERGEVLQKAMEILVALGNIYKAKDFVPVSSAQIAGVSYKNLGKPGTEFLEWWVEHGAKVKSFSTLNPAGIDLERAEELGFSNEFSEKQRHVVELYEKMGIVPTCTCTPYEIGNLPKYGDHVAWSESSAVSFVNTYIGARTNREGGPSALASSIIGKTPRYKFHLDEPRLANLVFNVTAPMRTEADFGALGVLAGKESKNNVPYFSSLPPMRQTDFKQLGAAMAAFGSVALYHVDRQTPEARTKKMVKENSEKYVIETLKPAYDILNTGGDKIDFVSIGCPHSSLEEIIHIAMMLKGKKVAIPTWITTSRAISYMAQTYGYKDIIEKSGAKIISDTCMVVSPIEGFGFETVATNSAKGCSYLHSWCNVETRFGDIKACLSASMSGRWKQ